MIKNWIKQQQEARIERVRRDMDAQANEMRWRPSWAVVYPQNKNKAEPC